MSGSFMIQILLGENWEGSDLDIYSGEVHRYYNYPNCELSTTDPNHFLIQKFLYEHGYQNDTVNGDSVDDLYPFTSLIVRSFIHIEKSQCPKIQNMFCMKNKPLKFIKTYFDLDFCKVAYDGQILYIHNLDALVSKTSLYGRQNIGTCESIRKKGKSGKYIGLMELAKSRIQKYRNRGFVIQLREEWSELDRGLFENSDKEWPPRKYMRME
jgi:hypothetical protein